MKTIQIALAIFLAASNTTQAQTGKIVGRVVGLDGRAPIVGATVRLNEKTVVTDRLGFFEITNAPTGRQVVTVEMIGFASRSDSVSVEDGRTTEIVLRLSQRPIAMHPIVVTVRSSWLEQNGYYERRTGGLSGKYITADDIKKRNSAKVTDLFHGVPGVKVQRGARGVNLVRMNHSATDGLPIFSQQQRPPGCEPGLWVDGARRQDKLHIEPPDWVHITDWDFLAPLTIDAIEIYTGSAGPINFQHPCGVILVWTRR